MDDRYQNLPELPDAPTQVKKIDREEKFYEEADYSSGDLTKSLGRPKTLVSQWRLLRIMRELPKQQIAASDLRFLFDVESCEDELIAFGLSQLERAGRIKRIVGYSLRTGGAGLVFKVTEKGQLNEHEREATEGSRGATEGIGE